MSDAHANLSAAAARRRPARRPDRRRRPLRHRRRLPPAAALPGQALRDPRGARRDRRHLGPVPLPRRPLRLRHVHARLLVPAVDRRARRSPTAPRSCATSRDTAREYGIDRHDPLRPPGACAPTGRRADARWTVHGERTDDGEPVDAAPARFLYVCSGYYRYDEGYTPELRRARSDSRAASSTRSTGPTTSTTPASASSSSAAAPPPSRWCRRWPSSAAHVTMLQRSPTYVVVAARRATAIADALRRSLPERLAYALVRWKNVLLGDGRSTSSAAAGRSRCKALLRNGVAARSCRTGLRRRHPLHARATTRGTSGCAWCPTATCSRRSATGARRSSPTRSTTLHRDGHPAGSRARSSTPTSSSPPPASS